MAAGFSMVKGTDLTGLGEEKPKVLGNAPKLLRSLQGPKSKLR